MNHLPSSSPRCPRGHRPGHPGRPTRKSSTASSGSSMAGRPWRDLPRPTYGPGRPSTSGSTAGARTAPGADSCRPSTSASTPPRRSTDPSASFCTLVRVAAKPGEASPSIGTSAEPSLLPAARFERAARLDLVCDGAGRTMAVTVTAGQRHELTQFEAVLGEGPRPPTTAGPPAVPAAEARGRQGHSYPHIRLRLRRRGSRRSSRAVRIGGVSRRSTDRATAAAT